MNIKEVLDRKFIGEKFSTKINDENYNLIVNMYLELVVCGEKKKQQLVDLEALYDIVNANYMHVINYVAIDNKDAIKRLLDDGHIFLKEKENMRKYKIYNNKLVIVDEDNNNFNTQKTLSDFLIEKCFIIEK